MRFSILRFRFAINALFAMVVVVSFTNLRTPMTFAQTEDAKVRAEAALQSESEEAKAPGSTTESEDAKSPSLFELSKKGGWLMLPILIMSILVVAIGIERALGLRKGKILPPELLAQLGGLAYASSKFDPKKIYRLCQKYPSSAANVIRASLLKLGRPQGEVEHAASEATQREADRLFSRVRSLNLAAAVTPLMGLLGTVWGMIQAFYATATVTAGANKSEALAQGIYIALITTFAGLAVAIPAAMLSHYFEGLIRRRLSEVDDLLGTLLPQMERYEGKLRVSKQQFDNGELQASKPEDSKAQRKSAPSK